MNGNRSTVVLTRAENNLAEIKTRYPQINWIDFPLIDFAYQTLTDQVKYEIEENYDWLIFTSQNGVKSFFDQSENIINLNNHKIACVGPKTAGLVEDYGYEIDFIPSHYTSLILAKELPSTTEESICYIGGNLSRYETLQVLKDKAKLFMQVEVYHTVSYFHALEDWQHLFATSPDIISFCSPSAVDSFNTQLEKYRLHVPSHVKFAAIGTTTADSILASFNQEAMVGESHTFQGMLDAIVQSAR
ncbi:uroporphyrinogen-III synthase [Portibacter marinus]|uniref:uroporphyrinogen-III synthase n=1 Tax=Portibacter marinus TaxID=2898660 RepID=UPI001F329E3D|nr:uroporphyrinogen-III synthase [Portibacter marinus]